MVALFLAMGVLAGFSLGMFLAGLLIVKYGPRGLLLKKRKLLEMQTLIKKLTWGTFFETRQRAQTGKPLDRPYGRKGAVFDWDKIQFNPVYLSRLPLYSGAEVDTTVILGPQAARPLELKIPIINGGMAYGSGYSLAAKLALAKGAAMAGTAANTGNGAFLEEERESAEKLIIQYTRGFWSKAPEILKQADMIEIALGHSARGPAPVRIQGRKLTPDVAARYGTIPGLDILMEARLPEVENKGDFKNLVQYLKEVSGGVPIAVKFGATHYLEQEMGIFVEGGADVLVFDGLEGGTHGGAPLIMDDIGLPIFPALCRAAVFFEKNSLRGRISLVVGGGLITPGCFAKCLALGADAVIIGTITALAQAHSQVTKALPWEPPTGLLYNDGKEKNKYNIDLGAKHLANYYQSCVHEMRLLAGALGKSKLRDLNKDDLVALDPVHAAVAGIKYQS
ncbi:MAG: FMN-binding glutamate synthase family protein [Firmicutes bacterium]|nr:FMN-binding glutamate synthase family protein [Bacillota bacterium]